MKLKKILIILIVIAATGFLLQQKFIQEPVLSFINQNIPWSISLFIFVKNNITSGSLIGMILYLMFVNIPLLPSPPAEAYVIFALSKGANIFGILIIATLVYILFAGIYYFIGRLFGQKILEKLLKRPIKYSSLIDRFIGPIIFFAYMVPVPLPIPLTTILTLLAGSYKTNLSKVIAAAGMGTIFRFLIVIILYNFFTPAIEQYLSPFKTLKIG